MSTNIVYNGVTYTIPATSDVDWGEAVSNFLIAIPAGMLTRVGGSWAITGSDLDFGSAYGLAALYYKSDSATIAQSGVLRLALLDKVSWRSDGNDKDLVLGPNTSDALLWDNVELATISGTQTLTNKTIDTETNTITDLRDANIAADALIAWSKIAFNGDFGSTSVITTGGVKLGSSFHVTLQADPSEDYDFVFPATDGIAGQALVKAAGGDLEWATIPGLALDESNLIVGSPSDLPANVDTSAAGDVLAGSVAGLTIKSDVITNLMVKSDAAIALSKLAALTASRAVATDASGFLTVSTVTATELGWVSGVTSGIQGQFNSITTNVLALQNIVSDGKEPMGLVVLPAPPTVTYMGSRQIKIAHPFSYYFKGTKVNSIADVTVTVPNTTGAYYLVFTNSGLTAAATTTVDILNQVIWSAFYWNASTSDYIFFEERHGISWTANEHKQAHLTRGAAYESGGAASGYVLASDALANIQIAIDATNFWDEDIRNALAAKLEGSNFDKWYRSGASGDWRKDASDTIPAFWAGTPPNGVAQINTTGGSWALNPVTNGNYFNCYIFATNSAEAANRFILIPGQNQAGTLSGAQAFSISTLSLGTLPVQEILPLYKVTLRYRTNNTNNNARVTIEAVEDIRRTTSPGVSAGVSGTHNSLSGRSDADSHPTAAITGLNGETASDTVRVTLPQDTKANLDALTRKKGTLVYATDLNTLFADDGSNLSAAGSGSGAGRKNYIQNPSAALSAATNWTPTANITVTRDTSTDIPRETTTGTAFKLVTSGNSEIATLISTPRLLDDTDLSRKLAIEIAINVAFAGWTIDIENCDTLGGTYTRIPLSTDSSGSTILPVTTGVFKSSVDMTASRPYVRFVITCPAAINTVERTAYFSDILLTPDGSTITSAVVGDWLSFTPTWGGNGSIGNGTITGKYRRVGNSAEVIVSVVSGTTTTYGSQTYYFTTTGIGTIDTTALPATDAAVGVAHTEDNGANYYTGTAWYQYATGVIRISSSASGTVWSPTVPFTPTASEAGNNYSIRFTVPIAEWAGSGTVNVAGNDVEYASNSDVTSTASVTTSGFAYGPAGTAISSNWTTNASWTRRVRFQTPIQTTDKIQLEINYFGRGWIPFEQMYPRSRQNTNFYGAEIQPVAGSSTDVDVAFNIGGYEAGTTYGANGTTWSNLSASSWRVRKTSASSVAGFEMHKPGVSAGLVPAQGLDGRTDGVAVPAGKIGQIVGAEQSGSGGNGYNTRTTTAATTGGDYVISLTLNKGIYLVGFHTVQAKATNTNSDRLVCYMCVGATVVTTDLASNNSNISGSKLVSTFTIPVEITADSTLVQVSVTMGTDNSVGATNSMWAVRIA
jgi:hypothetical protein